MCPSQIKGETIHDIPMKSPQLQCSQLELSLMNHLQLQSFVFYRVLGRKRPGQIVLQDELPGKRTFCFLETLLWSWFMWCLRSETGQVLLGVFCLKRKEAELDQEGPVRFFH